VGLLHDFGKIVFAQFLPYEFKQALSLSVEQSISLHAAEQQIIGTDHAVAGWMLMKKWNFPENLTDTIRRHHSDISPGNMMLSCLFVADQISKQLALEKDRKNFVKGLSPAMTEIFGGQLQDIIASLGDISNLENEAHVFAQAGEQNMKYRLWGVQG
jgi:uncharacterized protein Yka (UPF0111/DUF47 family)